MKVIADRTRTVELKEFLTRPLFAHLATLAAHAALRARRERGLVQHVGIRGRASVQRFDAERAQRLLARYLGEDQRCWDKRFLDTLGDPDNVFVRVVPDTVVARDVSYEIPQP